MAIEIISTKQQAAKIYAKKSPKQKRVIMTELFHSITVKNGSISVEYTKLAEAIAEKSQKTREISEGPKSGDRTAENDDNNRDETKKRTCKMRFVLHGWRGRIKHDPRFSEQAPAHSGLYEPSITVS